MGSDKSAVVREFAAAVQSMTDAELREAFTLYEYDHPGTREKLRKFLAGDVKPDQNRKWLCPECGGTGVSAPTPRCHRPGCDYAPVMVELSDRVYNQIGRLRWKAAEYDRAV